MFIYMIKPFFLIVQAGRDLKFISASMSGLFGLVSLLLLVWQSFVVVKCELLIALADDVCAYFLLSPCIHP